uniref:Uncharacterized protein n=1 Tax=Rousettus aegyptiacus TaxID=9407 RepID=A0A7J8G9U3_ROUAE|nr:hypothetical protein HJG63_011491 [Rousettus aegyptiacus]
MFKHRDAEQNGPVGRAPDFLQAHLYDASEGHRDARYHPDLNPLQRTLEEFAHLHCLLDQVLHTACAPCTAPTCTVCIQSLADFLHHTARLPGAQHFPVQRLKCRESDMSLQSLASALFWLSTICYDGFTLPCHFLVDSL